MLLPAVGSYSCFCVLSRAAICHQSEGWGFELKFCHFGRIQLKLISGEGNEFQICQFFLGFIGNTDHLVSSKY